MNPKQHIMQLDLNFNPSENIGVDTFHSKDIVLSSLAPVISLHQVRTRRARDEREEDERRLLQSIHESIKHLA